jgi:hypothetical protein
MMSPRLRKRDAYSESAVSESNKDSVSPPPQHYQQQQEGLEDWESVPTQELKVDDIDSAFAGVATQRAASVVDLVDGEDDEDREHTKSPVAANVSVLEGGEILPVVRYDHAARHTESSRMPAGSGKEVKVEYENVGEETKLHVSTPNASSKRKFMMSVTYYEDTEYNIDITRRSKKIKE